jgi:hypothetical protein
VPVFGEIPHELGTTVSLGRVASSEHDPWFSHFQMHENREKVKEAKFLLMIL